MTSWGIETGQTSLGYMHALVKNAAKCFGVIGLTPNFVAIVTVKGHIVGGKRMPADIGQFADEIGEMAHDQAKARDWFRLCRGAHVYNSPTMVAFMLRTLFAEMGKIYDGERDMSKQERTNDATGEAKAWSFVNISLDEEEIQSALDTLDDADVLWEMVNESLEGGYKLSLTVEKESGSYCASLTGKFCPPPNRDKTISGWHDTAMDALRVLYYKHNVKTGGVWKSPEGGTKRRG